MLVGIEAGGVFWCFKSGTKLPQIRPHTSTKTRQRVDLGLVFIDGEETGVCKGAT